MNVNFPYTVTATGRTVTCDRVDHIAQLIELTLFTSPGERVDRPDFGCGVQDIVFRGVDAGAQDLTTTLVEVSLRQAMRHYIDVRSVQTEFDDSTSELFVRVTYSDHVTETVNVVEVKSPL